MAAPQQTNCRWRCGKTSPMDVRARWVAILSSGRKLIETHFTAFQICFVLGAPSKSTKFGFQNKRSAENGMLRGQNGSSKFGSHNGSGTKLALRIGSGANVIENNGFPHPRKQQNSPMELGGKRARGMVKTAGLACSAPKKKRIGKCYHFPNVVCSDSRSTHQRTRYVLHSQQKGGGVFP